MDKDKCCPCGHHIPIFALLVLVTGVLWLLAELEMIALDLPWVPMLVIIVSLGLIVKHHHFQHMSKK